MEYIAKEKVPAICSNMDESHKDVGKKKIYLWASLVVQWLRILLPMQGTWVRALAREDPTCRGAAKPVHHNY